MSLFLADVDSLPVDEDTPLGLPEQLVRDCFKEDDPEKLAATLQRALQVFEDALDDSHEFTRVGLLNLLKIALQLRNGLSDRFSSLGLKIENIANKLVALMGTKVVSWKDLKDAEKKVLVELMEQMDFLPAMFLNILRDTMT